MTPAHRQLRLTPQAVIGLCVAVLGAALTLENLGILSAGRILGLWPLGVIAVGTAMFSRATDERAKMWAGFIIFAGVWLTLGRVFDLPVRLSALWPLGLVALGLMMVRRARGLGLRGPADVSGEHAVSDFAFWSGVERRVTSQVFRRADVTAVMGGIEMDFRQAAINGEAVLDVFVVMGGLEIRVPPDWTVTNEVVAVMAGAVDRSTGTPDSNHRLVLRGFVLMGGVEVKT